MSAGRKQREYLLATYAWSVFAIGGVTLVVRCLSLACSGTELCVVRAWIVLYALVGVDTVGERSVDGTAELIRTVKAR